MTKSERRRLDQVEQLGHQGAAGIDGLIELLGEPNWVLRRAVIEALAHAGEPAVAPLCRTLTTRRDDETRLAAAVDALVASSANVDEAVLALADHPTPAVVADAAQVLGRRRSTSATPTLRRLTKHQDDNVAVAAIEALGRLGGRAAVETLIACVNSGSFFRTFPAIDILGRSGDPRVVEPLSKLLTNPSYLPEAARALGRTGDRNAVPHLAALLTSRSDAVVRVAAMALIDLRERFQERLGGPAQAMDELFRATIGPESVRRLVRVLASAHGFEAVAICNLLGSVGNAEAAAAIAAKLDGPAALASCAAEALKRLGKDADAHVLSAIRSGSSERRKALLPAVTRSAAAEEVARCLEDPDPEVRALACNTLTRLGNPKATRGLFHLLDDPNVRVVHAAVHAIQALGSRETTPLALEALRSSRPAVRRAAAQILGYFGDRAALPALLAALHDPEARVREAALHALPYLDEPRAMEALLEATKSADDRWRAVSMRAVGHLPTTDQRVCSLLLRGLSDAHAWVRYYACQSLGRLGCDSAAGPIAKLLHDTAGQVRVAAVEALSHLDSPEAHQALRQAAEASDPDVRRAALVGLGMAKRAQDLPVLLAAAQASDSATRLMALAALQSFPSPHVLEALASATRDPDEQVRATALGLLAARPEPEATTLLVQQLVSGPSPERAKTALMLSSNGRVEGLLMALERADDELAPQLVSILARLDPPEAKAALLSAIKLDGPAARKAAAPALAAHADPEMLTALREAADHDPDPEIRRISGLLLSE